MPKQVDNILEKQKHNALHKHTEGWFSFKLLMSMSSSPHNLIHKPFIWIDWRFQPGSANRPLDFLWEADFPWSHCTRRTHLSICIILEICQLSAIPLQPLPQELQPKSLWNWQRYLQIRYSLLQRTSYPWAHFLAFPGPRLLLPRPSLGPSFRTNKRSTVQASTKHNRFN